MGTKGKLFLIIALAIVALVFTVWCLMDEIYYLAVFGLFIFGLQVYNYVALNKKK